MIRGHNSFQLLGKIHIKWLEVEENTRGHQSAEINGETRRMMEKGNLQSLPTENVSCSVDCFFSELILFSRGLPKESLSPIHDNNASSIFLLKVSLEVVVVVQHPNQFLINFLNNF